MTSRKRWYFLSLPAIVVLLLALGAFWGGRELGSKEIAVADPGEPTPPPNIDEMTPAPGETPNPRDPYSLVKWLNQDERLPRFDQTIAGIRVGPNAVRSGSLCLQNPPEYAPFEAAKGSRVWIEPAFLPEGARLVSSFAVLCSEPAFAELWYYMPLADDITRRVEAGEDYWSLPRGGDIQIYRFIGDPAEETSIPAARWEEVTVGGLAAAFGSPILDEGFGDSEVMIYQDGVLTVVRAVNLSRETVLKIAEGVLR